MIDTSLVLRSIGYHGKAIDGLPFGTHRTCTQQTVDRLWEDSDGGLLTGPVGERTELTELLDARGVAGGDWTDWHRIDRAERKRGTELSRPRLKFTESADMLAAAGRPSGGTT